MFKILDVFKSKLRPLPKENYNVLIAFINACKRKAKQNKVL